jgi:diguanylate cyclase (GGDEF)-like protein
METVLTRETARTRRYGGDLSIVFIDLNDFKKVNDTYGHDAGDTLLRHLSGILQKTCRDSDLVTRYAGDEFVLVLPETSPAAAAQLMGRLEKALQSHPFSLPGGEKVVVGLSHGIASLKDLPEGGPAELLKLADQRLYERKQDK